MKNAINSTVLAPLPTEVDALKSIIFSQQNIISHLQQSISSLEIKNQMLETLTESLKTQLARFNRHYYGAKTEAMSADQLSLSEKTKTEDFSAIEQLQDQADQQITHDQQTTHKKETQACCRTSSLTRSFRTSRSGSSAEGRWC